MTDERQTFKERYQDEPVEQLEVLAGTYLPNTEQRRILRELIAEKRRAADAPEQARHAASFEQKERHQRELKRVAQFAALVSIIGAAASWAGVWFQWHHSKAPVAPASLPPAVASPSPTQGTPASAPEDDSA
jgi:hypothetical protein